MKAPDADKVLRRTGDDTESVLLKVHLLRQRSEWEEARLLLEKATIQWPENDEVKMVLLQTEKDQLASKRQKKSGDYEIGTGPIEKNGQIAVLGLLGIGGAVWALSMIAETLIFLFRFGIAAPQATYTRVTRNVYYVPAHSNLIFPFLLLCFFVWLIQYAVRSYRS